MTAAPGELVVEIGPGTGMLTAELASRFERIIALELDERLAQHTRLRFRAHGNVEVVEADARDVAIAPIVKDYPGYAVAGNLPYFAANPIIRHFLETPPRPTSMVVMVQREVAQEIVGRPGKASILTIAMHVYATAEMLFAVPPEAFDPPPKVMSSVVRITPRETPLVPARRREAFFTLVTSTFKHSRKQIHNSLTRGTWLPPGGPEEALHLAGVDPTTRPERLDVPDWLRLLDAVETVRDRA